MGLSIDDICININGYLDSLVVATEAASDRRQLSQSPGEQAIERAQAKYTHATISLVRDQVSDIRRRTGGGK